MHNAFVVDANIIFAILLVKQSKTKKLFFELLEKDVKFFAPMYILEEIEKYLPILSEKKKLNYTDVKTILLDILKHIELVPVEKYIIYVAQLNKEVAQIDPKDIDYVALAYKLNCPLWTNDKRLKELKSVKVVSMEDLMGGNISQTMDEDKITEDG